MELVDAAAYRPPDGYRARSFYALYARHSCVSWQAGRLSCCHLPLLKATFSHANCHLLVTLTDGLGESCSACSSLIVG